MWIDNLLRALMLLLGILSFLGWGFSGETGMIGLSSLVSTGAVFAVALVPNEAFGDRYFRICWILIILIGLAAISFWVWSAYSRGGTDEDWQGLIFAGVTATGLLAGLARLRHSGEAAAPESRS